MQEAGPKQGLTNVWTVGVPFAGVLWKGWEFLTSTSVYDAYTSK